MILIIHDTVDGKEVEVARGFTASLRPTLRMKPGSLVEMKEGLELVYRETTFGRIVGWRSEIRGAELKDVPYAQCLTYLGIHENGLCNVHHPNLGVVWMMPACFSNARLVSDGSC